MIYNLLTKRFESGELHLQKSLQQFVGTWIRAMIGALVTRAMDTALLWPILGVKLKQTPVPNSATAPVAAQPSRKARQLAIELTDDTVAGDDDGDGVLGD